MYLLTLILLKYYETKQIEYEELDDEGSGLGSLTDDEDFV